MTKAKIKAISLTLVLTLLCVSAAFSLAACNLLFKNNIAAVRARVEKLRFEMADTIITGFKNNEVQSIKSLFCPKTQGLPDIDEQIRNSFSFMDGDIKSYFTSGDTSYESYTNDYGKIDEYSYGSDTYITTTDGRRYCLYVSVYYIYEDDSIKGMTFYSISENDIENYDDIKICRAGYNWTSPYDVECGRLTAELIKTIASKDKDRVKQLMCAEALQVSDFDSALDAALTFFDGNPAFTEREDGLYGLSDNENDFSCRVLGYDYNRDKHGNTVSVWVHVLSQPVCTDSGKRYALDFTAYLIDDAVAERIGIGFFALEDWDTQERVSAGSWIHE